MAGSAGFNPLSQQNVRIVIVSLLALAVVSRIPELGRLVFGTRRTTA